jgi:hypothetical protein
MFIKYILLFVVFMLNLKCNCQQQKSISYYFHKTSYDCDYNSSGKLTYYKIEFVKEKNPIIPCSYFFDFNNYSENEKIAMIQELLRYENDTSLCSVKIICYDPKRSQTVPNGFENYSIQVEALFIINHIILSAPYSYSAFPILRDWNGNNIETIKGGLIKEAFSRYKMWFEKVEKEGLSKTIKKKILPLDDKSSVIWY